jgi:hypothetical protein
VIEAELIEHAAKQEVYHGHIRNIQPLMSESRAHQVKSDCWAWLWLPEPGKAYGVGSLTGHEFMPRQ